MSGPAGGKDRVLVVSVGGTIEKTYDERDGRLKNKGSEIEDKIRRRLRLPWAELSVHSLMAKDSLDMTDDDRRLLAGFVRANARAGVPVVVLHGTDTMAETIALCRREVADPPVPVVFTGAMRPLGLEDSDALQNVAEALLAARLLPPGVHLSFHGRIHGDGVRKNVELGTFESDGGRGAGGAGAPPAP